MTGSNAAGGSSNNADSIETDEPPAVTLARPFRSRSMRPCDGCRRAKTRCAITEIGTPCVECQHTRKKCTFDELPRERKKPAKRSLSPEDASIDNLSKRPSKRSRRRDHSTQVPHLPLYDSPPERPESRQKSAEPISLEDTRGYHVFTSVLTDDLLPVGTRKSDYKGDCQIRQISTDTTKPQYVIFSKRGHRPRKHNNYLGPITAALDLLQPPPQTSQLLDFYLTSSNEAFPILPPPSHILVYSSSSPYVPEHPYPPPIMAKLYAAALNHVPAGLYRHATRCILQLSRDQDIAGPALPRSSLASISDALLDISSRPRGNVQEDYLTLARAIAEAQLLGLHVDCSNWSIPEWEKDVRRVLWWALRIHDGWSSFLNSRPSHIQANNHNVPLPNVRTIVCATQLQYERIRYTPPPRYSPAASSLNGSSVSRPGLTNSSSATASLDGVRKPRIIEPRVHSFLCLCRLGILVSRLQTQVSALMSPKEDRLNRVVDIEKEVESLLREAKMESGKKSTGFPSLMTCLLGFRCMVRRIAIELSIGLGSPFTPDPETLEKYAEAVEYISSLDRAAFDGFWLVYVGHILSSMTSSLIRLSLATTNTQPPASSPSSLIQVDSRTNPIFVLCRLYICLQNARDMYQWDLAEPALQRAESVATCLVGGQEYENVVRALKGTLFQQPLEQDTYTQQLGNWNIDLNVFGSTQEWTGTDGTEGAGSLPYYGFVST